jgi:RNA polymerase sigma-70 factor (ECF subfamily)
MAVIQCRHADRTDFMLKPTPRVNPSTSQGERALSLGELFDAEETPLLRYAFSLTGRRAVAEEIVQEVFLQLHANWKDVDQPKAWLMRSVRNQSFNYIRDNKREWLAGDDDRPPVSANENETPEQTLLRMESASILRNLVQQLSETDQQLVKLKYFEGLKYSDISTRTGLSVGNVGFRLHHLLKELADKLRSFGIDEKP